VAGSSLPGTTGAPARFAKILAAVFDPRSRIDSGEGPMKTIPASAQAVTGMDGLHGVPIGGLEDPVHAQVAFTRWSGPDMLGFVRQANVQGAPVGIREDRDAPNPHVSQRANNAHRDLATVGNQYLPEHAW
jgi:hypothetical protein